VSVDAPIPPERLLPELPPSAEYCEVSTATRLIGDRWSLLVVRELAVGNTRFSRIHDALPGLSRSLLAARLRYLERIGIIERRAVRAADRRSTHSYGLTDTGWGLVPVLRALGDWAQSWLIRSGSDDRDNVPLLLRRSQASVEPSVLPRGRICIQYYFADSRDSSAFLRVNRSGVTACLGVADEDADLVVRTTPATLSDLYWGRRTCRHAIARRDITFEGPVAYARAYPEWFPNRPAVRGAG
jgi:DNA-binding HxlR family transcriptional regulator